MTGLRIALIGYGKMGKTIQKVIEERGHTVSMIIDLGYPNQLSDLNENTDVAIEFTRPEAAVLNIRHCIERRIPIVSGTTGWLDEFEDIRKLCLEKRSAFFYASNYSIGVNLFFAINKYIAKIMNNFPEYSVLLREIHHTQKLDAPSGTAITLAKGILENSDQKKQWVNHIPTSEHDLGIISERINDDPGTHIITYTSPIDEIIIEHKAHSRIGFALGAVTAAEWIVGKEGCFSMPDMLQF